MRHEAAVQLTDHPSKKDPHYHFTYQDIADFNLLEGDYNFPKNWSLDKKMRVFYASSSEYQLLKCLEWYNLGEGTCPPICVDRYILAAMGVTPTGE